MYILTILLSCKPSIESENRPSDINRERKVDNTEDNSVEAPISIKNPIPEKENRSLYNIKGIKKELFESYGIILDKKDIVFTFSEEGKNSYFYSLYNINPILSCNGHKIHLFLFSYYFSPIIKDKVIDKVYLGKEDITSYLNSNYKLGSPIDKSFLYDIRPIGKRPYFLSIIDNLKYDSSEYESEILRYLDLLIDYYNFSNHGHYDEINTVISCLLECYIKSTLSKESLDELLSRISNIKIIDNSKLSEQLLFLINLLLEDKVRKCYDIKEYFSDFVIDISKENINKIRYLSSEYTNLNYLLELIEQGE